MGPLNNQMTTSNKLTLITSSVIFLFLFMFINTANAAFPSYSLPPSPPPRHETQETKNDNNIRVAYVSKPTKDHHESSLPSTTSDHDHDQYQVFYIKNPPPFFLDKERLPPPHNRIMNARKRKRSKFTIAKERKKKRPRKVISSDYKTRPFMVMLPKGFVPPSGASPCHNSNPNSKVTFYCDLSSTTKP